MDNITHTLVGLALAEAGFKRRSRLGTATLVVGANLPDVDGLVYLASTNTEALAFRRGWTHGVLAVVVLPLLLTAVVVGWDRMVTRRREPAAVPLNAWWILGLAVLGVGSHPILDLLNTYGVRLLMPFSGRWFYGDTLFIVDPWLWLVLGVGITMSRRASRAGPSTSRVERPARIALGTSAAYVLIMAASARLGIRIVEHQAAGPVAGRILVAPLFFTPFRRQVVRELGSEYEEGVLAWGWPTRYTAIAREPIGRGAPGVGAASTTREGAAFLRWARFPQFQSEASGGNIRVFLSDVRYGRGRTASWATASVQVPAAAP
jgi:inner membrane protein